MKTAGIIGGIAPESTIVYYKEIVRLFRAVHSGNDYPQVIINSINMTEMLSYISTDKLDELVDYLLAEVGKLERAGADFAVLASNTPHLVFEKLQERSSLPLLSIVEHACQSANALHLKRLGLFGTKFTMQNSFYQDRFRKDHIEVITPDAPSQNYIHEKYFNELVHGVVLDETKIELLGIIEGMKLRHNIDGLILGGTELSLILKDGDDPSVPILDTAKIHIEAIVEHMLKEDRC